MNPIHIHLAFNHLPIIIPGIALLLLMGGWVWKSALLRRTALGLYLIAAITAAAASATGDEAEHIAEKIQGIEEQYVEEHEEAAETFTNFSIGLAVLASLGIWASWKEKKWADGVQFVLVAATIFNLYLAQQTGTTGGEIRHPEIRKGAVLPASHED